MKRLGCPARFLPPLLAFTAAAFDGAAAAPGDPVLPPPPAPASASTDADAPDSARERARAMVREDRQFLEGMETIEQPLPRAAGQPPTLAPEAQRASAEAVRRFVRDYLDAAMGSQPDREIAFYGEQVDYFDQGRISQAAVARDQQAYYRRWPARRFALEEEPEVLRISPDGATVRFRIRYEVQRGESRARGTTENVMRLHRDGEVYRIVAIRERKLR